jgi:hypothetical protein
MPAGMKEEKRTQRTATWREPGALFCYCTVLSCTALCMHCVCTSAVVWRTELLRHVRAGRSQGTKFVLLLETKIADMVVGYLSMKMIHCRNVNPYLILNQFRMYAPTFQSYTSELPA